MEHGLVSLRISNGLRLRPQSASAAADLARIGGVVPGDPCGIALECCIVPLPLHVGNDARVVQGMAGVGDDLPTPSALLENVHGTRLKRLLFAVCRYGG